MELPTIITDEKTKDCFFRQLDISDDDHDALYRCLQDNDVDGYLTIASRLMMSTEYITNMYVYLYSAMATMTIDDALIATYVCKRLQQRAAIGWFKIIDPDIVNYINEHSDLNLPVFKDTNVTLDTARSLYHDAFEYVKYEEEIRKKYDDLDKTVLYYFAFVKKLYDANMISQEQVEEVREKIRGYTAVYEYRDEPITVDGFDLDYSKLVGSLLLEETQEEIGIQEIMPRITKKTMLENLPRMRAKSKFPMGPPQVLR